MNGRLQAVGKWSVRWLLRRDATHPVRQHTEADSQARNCAPSSFHHFLELPRDILVLIPDYLDDIEDFLSLIRTCRALREVYSKSPSPRTMLRLCSGSTLAFFRPKPLFLVAALAEQLAAWASQSETNVTKLRQTFRGGIHAVYELALEHCGLSMDRLRELHALRYSTIDVVTDWMDKCVGKQWYDTPGFWSGGVDDAVTICAEPQDQFFQLATYGGLFGPTLRAFLENGTLATGPNGVIVGDVVTRLEYLKYCVPDPACVDSFGQQHTRLPDGSINPLMRVDRVGPYYGSYLERMDQAQMSLDHLFRSGRFNKFWHPVRTIAGPEFADDPDEDSLERYAWKQRLWQVVVMSHGLEGMRMVSEDGRGAELWRDRLKVWWSAINAMDEEPKVEIEGIKTYEFPYIKGDIEITSGPW